MEEGIEAVGGGVGPSGEVELGSAERGNAEFGTVGGVGDEEGNC